MRLSLFLFIGLALPVRAADFAVRPEARVPQPVSAVEPLKLPETPSLVPNAGLIPAIPDSPILPEVPLAPDAGQPALQAPLIAAGPLRAAAPLAGEPGPGLQFQLDFAFDGSPFLNIAGVPGPGVTREHLAAMQKLADELDRPVAAMGSRQTGVTKHGRPFRPDSDLDIGVIGGPLDAVDAGDARWRDVPDVVHAPWFARPSVGAALDEGMVVVLPSPAAPAGRALAERRREVQNAAAPWRTARQLDALSKTPRKDDETFKFTVLGDAEPGRFAVSRLLFNVPGAFKRLLKESETRAVDFTMQLGDMVSRGTMGRFLKFFKTLAGLAPKKPYLTVIGNHDRARPHGESNSRLYRTLFGRTDYFFDHGGVRFVTLDSSAGKVSARQLEWLDKALDTPKKKIVFTHMAPGVIKPWVGRRGDKTWGGFKDGGDAFTRIVARRGVLRVYVGHIHGFRPLDYRGVRYVVTGGGGSPLYPGGVRNNFHHYVTVEIGPSGIKEVVHKADGSSFSIP